MASNTILVKCEMSQAMIFLYQKFTKSAKKCSQGFNPTSPGGRFCNTTFIKCEMSQMLLLK